jgi:hypothetical protein
VNLDLALIYNTDQAFEKGAAAGQGQVSRPTLADYAVYLTHGDEVPADGPDLEKCAEAHNFLLEHDRAGRAYAQLAFSELEAKVQDGDEAALGEMAELLGDVQPVTEKDKLAAAVRQELVRRLEKTAGIGSMASDAVERVSNSYGKRLMSGIGRGASNVAALKAGAAEAGKDLTTGQVARARLKGVAREFAPEIAGGAGLAAVAGGAAGFGAGRRSDKTTVIYKLDHRWSHWAAGRPGRTAALSVSG